MHKRRAIDAAQSKPGRGDRAVREDEGTRQMILGLTTAWHYDAPIWSGSTSPMESHCTQTLPQHRVKLVQLTSWDCDLGDDDSLGSGIRLTLH